MLVAVEKTRRDARVAFGWQVIPDIKAADDVRRSSSRHVAPGIDDLHRWAEGLLGLQAAGFEHARLKPPERAP